MEIRNNQQDQRFETEVGGGLAFLRYRLGEGKISLLYVEVPPASRGQGIAAEITRTALEYAKAQNLRVTPICGYTVAYLRRHPEYQNLLD